MRKNRNHRQKVKGLLLATASAVFCFGWHASHADIDPPSEDSFQLASRSVNGASLGMLVNRLPLTPLGVTPIISATTETSSLEAEPNTLQARRDLNERNFLKRASSHVLVRLFADDVLRGVTVESVDGLWIGQDKVFGKVTLSLDHGKILVRDQNDLKEWRSSILIASRGAGSIDIHRPHASGRRTHGALRVSVQKDHLKIVNSLELESYLLGIIEPELGSLRLSDEALKAQLVASRSYVLAVRDRHPHEDYEFCDSIHCQVYGGTVFYPDRFIKAAASCEGQYLSYHGHPAAAFFHHSCGGKTAAAHDVWPEMSAPYLRSVNDGSREFSTPKGRLLNWHFSMSREALKKCFKREGWEVSDQALDSLCVIRRDSSGRAHQILVESHSSRWIHGNKFRAVINRFCKREAVKSTLFTIERKENLFYFQGKGWGHGVGLCQTGALAMAQEGKTYLQILNHYYPGTQLSQLPQNSDKRLFPKSTPLIDKFLKNLTPNL